eukprot:gene28061-34713_t
MVHRVAESKDLPVIRLATKVRDQSQINVLETHSVYNDYVVDTGKDAASKGKRRETAVKLVDQTVAHLHDPSCEVTHVLVEMDMTDGKSFQLPGLSINVFPFARTRARSVKTFDGFVVSQFPIRLLYSCTGNKVQGRTIRRALVVGDINNRMLNYLYVICTRVGILQHLFLARALTDNDARHCGPDARLRAEYERLQQIQDATIKRIESCPEVSFNIATVDVKMS